MADAEEFNDSKNLQKFSDLLTSEPVDVVVGTEVTKKYRLHEALLIQESPRLARGLNGFKEGEERKIVLSEEDPALFGYFVEYLYRDGWVSTLHDPEMSGAKLMVLARLYCLGHRLMAEGFQRTTLQKLMTWASFFDSLTICEVCELLDMTCMELPDLVNEDPLKDCVLRFAAWRLHDLQNCGDFAQLLSRNHEVAQKLCLRAGVEAWGQPEVPVDNDVRFKPESLDSYNEADSLQDTIDSSSSLSIRAGVGI